METNRQRKIARIIQRDMAEILQQNVREAGIKGLLISVTKVNVTADLTIAKIYLSIFPVSEIQMLMEAITANQSQIRHQLAQRVRHQFRRVPELQFGVDDSLEYIDTIEKALKGTENPVENPELLPKRKRS